MAITVDRFLRGVKRRVTVAANNQLLGDSDLLELGDDVLKSRMVPLLKSLNGNFFLATTTEPLVSGTDAYDIPYRAVGRKFHDVKLSVDGTTEGVMNLLQIDDAYVQAEAVDGVPIGYYYRGDQIVLRPSPNYADGYLELWYYLQPSCLVTPTAAARVTGINDPVVTVASLPSTMTAGVDVDFVQGRSGNRLLAMDEAITNVAGTQLTFAADTVPSTLRIGDYIALAGETPVLQIPDEAYPLFETLVGQRILYAISDFEGSKTLENDVKEETTELKKLLEPRTDQEPIKTVNPRGLLRGRRLAGRYGRGLYI